MKLLALDVGDKRIGVAFGDTRLQIATPLQVFERGSLSQDASTLHRLILDYEAEQVIVGLPRNTDGTLGDQAKQTQAYASALEKDLSFPILLWDEHLSTVEATRRRQESSPRGKKSRRKLDAIAAAVILQDYMDSQSSRNQNAE